MLRTAADWLRARDTTAIATAEIERARRSEPGQVGRLAAIAGARPVQPGTRFRRATEVAWHVDSTADHAELRAGDVALRFPRRIEPALRRVADAPTVSASDLGEHLVESGALVLLGRLEREGLLRRCDGR